MRFNTGPVVADEATAEICRQNFIQAVQNIYHPVYDVMMDNFASIIDEHIGCDCFACNWREAEKVRRIERKQQQSTVVTEKTSNMCKEDRCLLDTHARGMCKAHYKRWLRRNPNIRHEPANKRTCSKDGCAKPARSRGMCKTHYNMDQRKRNLTA